MLRGAILEVSLSIKIDQQAQQKKGQVTNKEAGIDY